MIARVNGREVAVVEDSGRLMIRLHCRSEVDTAYVNGDQVNVQLENGHCEIYKLNGTVVRRF